MLEKRFPNLKLQNPVAANNPYVRAEIGPGPIAQVTAKRAFFGIPPIFSTNQGGGEDNRSAGSGKKSVSAIGFSEGNPRG